MNPTREKHIDATEVFDVAQELGVRMACAQSALPELALLVVKAGCAGSISGPDAESVYAAYWTADGRRRGKNKSFKVQVAKLRKVIQLGEVFRFDGVKLMRDTMALHAQLYLRTSVTYLDCYNAMVGVARRQVNRKSKVILSEALMKRAMRA